MSSEASAPDTIVLIHGFWVTPRSWENWVAHYEAKGFRVLTPAYPGFEVEVEALNADPTPIEELTVPQVVEHLESVVGGARLAADHHGPLGRRRVHAGPARPRLRRRGRGDQLGAHRGCEGDPAVAGQGDLPRAQEPREPAQGGRLHLRPVALRVHQHVQRGGVARLYERYHVPASGNVFWGSVLANIQPGHDDTYVNYKNDDRAPLLFISGSEDHLMPPKIQQSNAKHYKSDTVTEVKEYEGFAHLLPAQEGWEEIADYALDWALEHAKAAATAPA